MSFAGHPMIDWSSTLETNGTIQKKMKKVKKLPKNWKLMKNSTKTENMEEENPKTKTEQKLERTGPGGTPSSKTGNQWKSSEKVMSFHEQNWYRNPMSCAQKNSETINAKSCVICAYYGANHKVSETLLGRVYWPLEIGEV